MAKKFLLIERYTNDHIYPITSKDAVLGLNDAITEATKISESENNILWLDTNGLSANVGLKWNGTLLQLVDHNDKVISTVNGSDFIKDGMLNTVELIGTDLVFTFNTDSGKEAVRVNMSSFVDLYDGSNLLLTDFTIPNTYTEPKSGDSINSAIANLIKKNRIINNSITDIKIKDVDGTTLVKDENGVASVSYITDLHGRPSTKAISYTPIRTHFNKGTEGLFCDNLSHYYNGDRPISDTATNVVQEKALAKHLNEINTSIQDNKDTTQDIEDNVSKIVEIITNNNGSNLEKLTSAKTALDSLGDGYKTLLELATTIKTFITDTDVTNETINSWKEIENFLQGITDTETLTGIIQGLKIELENKINEFNGNFEDYKVKDVDGKTITKNENGVISLNYSKDFNGFTSTSINSSNPIQVRLTQGGGILKVDVKGNTYAGNRDISSTATNLVEEKALYKHITILQDAIDEKSNFLDLSNVLAEEFIGNEEEITGTTREELKKDLFIDLWNKACGSYGSYNVNSKYFELNGLTDITYELALLIYSKWNNSNYMREQYVNANIRTNIPHPLRDGAIVENAFYSSSVEIVRFSYYSGWVRISRSDAIFRRCKKLRKILDSQLEISKDNLIFEWCESLEDVNIKFTGTSLSLAQSPLLSLESVQYMIQNSSNGVTFVLHPSVYLKITDETNTEWHPLLLQAESKDISIATA